MLHLLFLHPKPRFLLKTYHGSKILRFDNESSFLLKIHVIFYCQYAKFCNAAYVHLDLLQSFFKIKPLVNCSKNLWSLIFCFSEWPQKVSNKLCLIMNVLAEKNLDIIHFLLRQQLYSIWTINKDLMKLGVYNMSNPSLFEVSNNTQDETGCQCGRKQLRPGKIQFFSKISSKLKIKF